MRRITRALYKIFVVVFFFYSPLLILDFLNIKIKLLQKIPLQYHRYFRFSSHVLIKKSYTNIPPKNYIILAGDSYAYGEGDWRLYSNYHHNTGFSSGFVLHQITKQDVLEFGKPGASSLKAFTFTQSSWKAFKLLSFIKTQPKVIFIFFYEGNDLYDNLNHLQAKGLSPNNPDTYVQLLGNTTPEMFNELLRVGFCFTKAFNSLLNAVFKKKHTTQLDDFNRFNFNRNNPLIVQLKKNKKEIPNDLQAPALFLSEEEIKLSLNILSETLKYWKKAFPHSKIVLVNIPSPASVYNIISPTFTRTHYLNYSEKKIFKTSFIHERSQYIASQLEKLTGQQNITFLDLRSAFKQAAQENIIHGPTDWFHFNKLGYQILGGNLAKFVLNNNNKL
ncbi:MAG: SGNH/GDSL hydrolase family protein [Deltaproteobacteria bacterium]|nr:SGNH/GDSL hydrolase family protein [Deltaproteobacteria bacterium]